MQALTGEEFLLVDKVPYSTRTLVSANSREAQVAFILEGVHMQIVNILTARTCYTIG